MWRFLDLGESSLGSELVKVPVWWLGPWFPADPAAQGSGQARELPPDPAAAFHSLVHGLRTVDGDGFEAVLLLTG